MSIGYAGARLSRLGHWEALALGAGINARGIIVALVGLRSGVLSVEMYTIIVLVAIVTSLMAPPLLRFAMARVDYTAEERLREPTGESDQAATQRDQLIKPGLGLGRAGCAPLLASAHRLYPLLDAPGREVRQHAAAVRDCCP